MTDDSIDDSIYLRRYTFDNDTEKAFTDDLKRRKVKYLNIAFNTFSKEKQILTSLQLNLTITTINLGYCNLGSDGGILIADILKVNRIIKSLNLSFNNIGVIGGIAIANSLSVNNTLTDLQLYNNNLGSFGGFAIANALKYNTSLTFLELWKNNLCSLVGAAFIETLKINHTLTCLYINNNYINSDDEILITLALMRNKELHDIPYWSITRNNIFPHNFHYNVICILLSASRFLPALPEELWTHHIFPHLRFSDFN